MTCSHHVFFLSFLIEDRIRNKKGKG